MVNSLEFVMCGIKGWIIRGVFVWFIKMLVVEDMDLGWLVFSVFCKKLLIILMIKFIILRW